MSFAHNRTVRISSEDETDPNFRLAKGMSLTMSYHVFAAFYDLLTENIDYKKRAAYFCKIFKKHGFFDLSGRLLLDLCCGTGSLTYAFEKSGFDVTGVDKSAEMLSIAEKKRPENSRALFLNQDALNLNLFGTADLAVSALDSINHLKSTAELRKVFEKVSLFLNDGGLFVFDVNSLYKHKYVLADNCFVYDRGDVFCGWANEYDAKNKKTDIYLDFFTKTDTGYERLSEAFSEQFFSKAEISAALKKAGFSLLEIYAADTLSPPTAKTERIIYTAKKLKG